MRLSKLLLAAVACSLLLSACQAYEPYVPGWNNSGYQDLRIEDDVYQVSFVGRPNISKDQVWVYWIYRCAELTREKGYDFFAVATPPKATAAARPRDGGLRFASYRRHSGHLVLSHGGGGYHYTPIYIGGGGYVSSWRSSGVVKMYHEPISPAAPYVLRVQVVLDSLKPYVDSGGKTPAPPREQLLAAALMVNPAYVKTDVPVSADPLNPVPSAGQIIATTPATDAKPAEPPASN